VGGAIANDVHGKNHQPRWNVWGITCAKWRFTARIRAGDVQREENPDLFHATIGGLGLTGIIAWAEIQLRRIWSSRIDAETFPITRCGVSEAE